MGKFRVPSKAEITAPFQSKEAFIEFIRTPEGNDGHATVGDPKWSNKDLEPTPEEQRTWTWYVPTETNIFRTEANCSGTTCRCIGSRTSSP
jgi:NCS1 family nucleobase:cation symporter-1